MRYGRADLSGGMVRMSLPERGTGNSMILAAAYDWLRALHILAVIAWMAAMLYLPRLFVYHCGARPGGELDETLKIQERRLLKGIMNPAMIATWLFG